LIAAAGLLADVSINVSEGQVIELVANPAFIPQPLPGFGAVYGEVWAIAVDDDGQATLEAGAVDSAGRWIGVRNRYFTALLSGIEGGQVEVFVDAENQPRVTITPEPGQQTVFFKLYAGPVEQQSLVAADPVLTKMLFAALWDFLRWLCFGMLWLLTTIHGVVGNIGLSIILLSVAVKILMSPLTKAADRLQASVNTTAALLQPELADIKRNFKGEEAHNMVLAVYKKHGVHPLYTMKSLAGFLLQIPIFIAAFDMLGENYALYQASFLWIDDLSKPDQWLPLLINVPFFGGYLNLLPCLMTFFTLLTSWLQRDETLTEDLARSQQNRLFWMAGAFFLLFYTFPAGMVLYWTTNNVLALGRESFARIRGA
ncbi:MAG: membrane protein insertase YidC, partial [Gammaproteobacteria bacterium]|nr:membrane protein insertase YidC [Gammaproteobacteria bacterium]